jgi:hypothetical protein
LSSMTMTRATDVTANVQMASERPCMKSFSFSGGAE